MTAVMPDYTISKRVRDVWKKFGDWYGADVITKKLGAIPSREWCEAIDNITSRVELDQILADVRATHVNWPPLFPQFEAIVARARRPPPMRDAIPMTEQLTKFVLRTKRLTAAQVRSPWTFLYGTNELGDGRVTTGVVIPADSEAGAPGYRVMAVDMQLGGDL